MEKFENDLGRVVVDNNNIQPIRKANIFDKIRKHKHSIIKYVGAGVILGGLGVLGAMILKGDKGTIKYREEDIYIIEEDQPENEG